ncbi:MAG TPA: hypothetical protein VHD32_14045 [Candidatus Didemnitutus sp.]|nr:hypothetical protein [Candidatus Didemnitutus sp.]
MKRLSLFVVAMWAFATVMVRAADTPFTEAVSPADLKAAGLDQLSPEQLGRLNELVRAYKHDELEAAHKSAQEARAAQKAAEAEAKKSAAAVAQAEAAARAAKSEAAESKKASQGFLAKAKVLLVPGTSIEYAVITTTILGKFHGWDGRTVFQMANGQTWQVANSNESYFTPPKENVEVMISPSMLGGFWMDVPKLRTKVRVHLLSQDHTAEAAK